MFSEVFPQVSGSPSLVWVASAVCFHIVNSFLGAFMAFRRKGPMLVRTHRFLYFAILTCLGIFLVLNEIHAENSIWEYLICLYFITLIPLSKSWDAVVHAFIASIGLILLPVLILLQL